MGGAIFADGDGPFFRGNRERGDWEKERKFKKKEAGSERDPLKRTRDGA